MPMALGMKDISNLGYMHCTTAVSLEMSDEPKSSLLCSTSVELWQQHAKATRLTLSVAVAVHNSISFGVRYTTKVR